MEKVPAEYDSLNQQLVAGTDIYLACVSVVMTCGIVHMFFTTLTHIYGVTVNHYLLIALMAIPSVLSAHNVLTLRSDRYFRSRIWVAIASSLNLIFISPLTIPAQIAQSTCTGFSITRKLFD